jgi:TolB-like protein/Flp pilus assembly protein TadD
MRCSDLPDQLIKRSARSGFAAQYTGASMKVLKKPQKKSKKIASDRVNEPPQSIQVVYSFGPFYLNEAERMVLRDGQPVPLAPKVFDMLLILVKSAGRLVSKERLLQETWPEVFVGEANISVNIATLRRVLGGGPDEHEYIKTVPKCGYRFVADVIEDAENIRDVRASWPRQESSHAGQRGASGKDERFYSVAVLPFHNERADPNAQYLANGLTEGIIRNLSRLKNLRVVAHNTVFRYRGKYSDPQIVGRELQVDSVLAGSVLHWDNHFVVRTELIDAVNGWQIWGRQYRESLSDIFEVETEISQEISEQLELTLTRNEKRVLYKHHTESAEAYQLYLKGRYHWNKYDQSSLKNAIDYFSQAIEIDPAYALAYAGLADSYYRLSNAYAPTRDGMSKAKAAAVKALEIDENLSETHAALGLIKLFYEWDWLGAEDEFARAIEINPKYAVAHQRLGLYFNLCGRFGDARRELGLAMAIDPLSTQTYWGLALGCLLTGEYERAIKEIHKAFELDSHDRPALYLLGRVYEEVGQFDLAIAIFKKLSATNGSSVFLAALGHAYALAGKNRDARRVLNLLNRQSKDQYVSPYGKAVIHLALGDRNQSFSCLEQAYEQRCEMMTWIKIDPAFDSIRTDLRFTSLLGRLGLDRERQVLLVIKLALLLAHRIG